MDGNQPALIATIVVGLTVIFAPTAASADGPTCFGGQPTIVGTDQDDHLVGTPGADVIAGLDGADTIDGEGGDDLICAGSDAPPSRQRKPDRLFGGNGNDRLSAAVNSWLDGQAGDDEFVSVTDVYSEAKVTYSDSPVGVRIDRELGTGDGWGQDTFTGLFSRVMGSRHDDVLLGLDVSQSECAQGGCEALVGLAGDDVIRGRAGRDGLIGGAGDDRLYGGHGRDAYVPGSGDDRMSDSGDSHDTIWFTSARRGVTVDLAAGVASGQGHDRLRAIEDVNGSNHADVIKGSHTVNHLYGARGADRMYGRGRHDVVGGEDGDDVLVGGPGPRDLASGGDGTDRCDAETVEDCER